MLKFLKQTNISNIQHIKHEIVIIITIKMTTIMVQLC